MNPLKNTTSVFEKLLLLFCYASLLCTFSVLLSLGSLLSMLAISVALVVYYPITFCSWLVGKMKRNK